MQIYQISILNVEVWDIFVWEQWKVFLTIDNWRYTDIPYLYVPIYSIYYIMYDPNQYQETIDWLIDWLDLVHECYYYFADVVNVQEYEICSLVYCIIVVLIMNQINQLSFYSTWNDDSTSLFIHFSYYNYYRLHKKLKHSSFANLSCDDKKIWIDDRILNR